MTINESFTPTAAAIALVLGIVASAPASAIPIISIDIGGVEVDGGTVTSVTAPVGEGTVTEIAFDFEVDHLDPSWGSETDIKITAPDSTAFVFEGFDDFGFDDSSGVFTFMGSFPIAPTDALGTWSFEFTDSFDDPTNPDHIYLTGSTIALNGAFAVPTPATLSLLVGGLGAWGLRRRRKNVS